MKRKPILHKSDHSEPHWDSTCCGLVILSHERDDRISKTWPGTTCGNCLRVGRRGKWAK